MSDKTLNTLVKDIYGILTGDAKVSKEASEKLGQEIGAIVHERLSNGNREPRLSPSSFGTNCDRKLWYSINNPDKKEALEPWVRFKFLYGDILEALTLFLAEEAGHKVVGRQDKINVEGIEGSRDAIIDGVLVDVKSANSRGMGKFKNHELATNDPFGYLDQASLYLEGSLQDPELQVKGEFAFLAVDKELGHLVVDRYKKLPKDWKKEITAKRLMLSEKNPPKRGFEDVADGKSGNRKLSMNCSYCDFKNHCWSDANNGLGLRTFIYSTGPTFLTKTERLPDVTEISKK